jgi:hypothetical protein
VRNPKPKCRSVTSAKRTRSRTDAVDFIVYTYRSPSQHGLDRLGRSLRFAWGKRPEPRAGNHQLPAQAKVEAIRKWEERWHADPRTSLAYRTACVSPPDGRLHPILTAKASRANTSTMFRLITGHAFAGEYTARFLRRGKFPSPLPEEFIACPCGERTPHGRTRSPRMPNPR